MITGSYCHSVLLEENSTVSCEEQWEMCINSTAELAELVEACFGSGDGSGDGSGEARSSCGIIPVTFPSWSLNWCPKRIGGNPNRYHNCFFLYLNVYRGDPNKKVRHYNMVCQNVVTINLQHISPCFAMNFIRIPTQNNR